MTPSRPPVASDAPPKATLFCADCGHQSRYDGDWSVRDRRETTQVRCPECGHVVASRPARSRTRKSARESDRDPDRESTPVSTPTDRYQFWQSWETSVDAWHAVWRGTTSVFFAGAPGRS